MNVLCICDKEMFNLMQSDTHSQCDAQYTYQWMIQTLVFRPQKQNKINHLNKHLKHRLSTDNTNSNGYNKI